MNTIPSSMDRNDVITVLGVPVHRASRGQILAETQSAISGERSQVCFACANPHSLVVAKTDRVFTTALLDSDIVVADGVGILLGARLMGLAPPPRITGHDYYTGTMSLLNNTRKSRVFFMGSTEKVLENIREKVKRQYPDIEICGTYSPPFREFTDEDNATIIEMINKAAPHVLWVGMTAPKQEKWVHKCRSQLSVPVIGSIGAVFDFVAGTHPRAPAWVTDAGLEWLYRLIREPRRMWQRNFNSTPRFLVAIIRDRITGSDNDKAE